MEQAVDMSVAEEEFLAFGWERGPVAVPGPAGAPEAGHIGFSRGDFAAVAENGTWLVIALPARLALGRLPSASAVRRFAAKCVSFPAEPNGAIIGAARQAMLQAVEEELSLARQSADLLEAKIDDLMGSIDDIRAKAILFTRDD